MNVTHNRSAYMSEQKCTENARKWSTQTANCGLCKTERLVLEQETKMTESSQRLHVTQTTYPALKTGLTKLFVRALLIHRKENAFV
jgi:hypothetical protein